MFEEKKKKVKNTSLAMVDEHFEFVIGELDFAEVINYLCKGNGEWKMSKGLLVSFKGNQLYEAYKCWLYFIAARVLLVKHVSDITKDRTLLLYCILIRKAIDLGRTLYNTILRFANTPREGIWTTWLKILWVLVLLGGIVKVWRCTYGTCAMFSSNNSSDTLHSTSKASLDSTVRSQ
ncbi:Uncharacterized protein TCM_023965 [Theobroma cacao]|uniref:Putative plant transposon protein domain-containing protein n=1 Tax=Theobroma cacao TaxID=3641 RepID=A0A061EVH1_THECC|nr:Uncharacterized protein TCM_023965 [Theobroma cacao]